MAKAKKLPSGSWRAQVYSYTDKDGKKHRESFTAATKAEAEMMAAEYAAGKSRKLKNNLTVKEAISGYIEVKEGVLSPSTIAGYAKMLRNNYKGIEDKRINSLRSEDMQRFVSDLASDHSSKTVSNAYNLLTAAIGMYAPDLTFKVTMPPRRKRRPASPDNDAVKSLFDAAHHKLKIAIGFGMVGLREGEIAALEYSDLEGDLIHVWRDVVRDRTGKWVVKEMPKTEDGDRYVRLPGFLLELIGEGEGRIDPVRPSTISKQFAELRDKLELNGIRFHDLRHYFASSAAVLGIPDIYTADMGGWQRGGSVMKSVYQNNITSMSEYYSRKIADHMDGVISGSR